jgi:hypothetical protein
MRLTPDQVAIQTSPFLRLQHVVDEGVAQAFGDVEGVPLLGLRVQQRQAAAVGAHRHLVAQLADVEHAVGQQAALGVEELVLVGARVVAHRAARGADPHHVAVDEDALDVLVADAEVGELLRRVGADLALALGLGGGRRGAPAGIGAWPAIAGGCGRALATALLRPSW